MTRFPRAVWRLARLALHIGHGIAIVLWRFHRLPPEARRARVQWWAAKLLRVAGLDADFSGTPLAGRALLVANHVSWLDICAIHAVCPQARFVSKADVQRWPIVGRLAGAANTLYLERSQRRDAMRVVQRMGEVLAAGDLVAVFPEGTTGEGHEVLPFHANLLQAAIVSGVPLQPLALRYADARSAVSPAVAYVGDTSLLQSVWWVVNGDRLRVQLDFLAPVEAAGRERRELARDARARIERALGPRARDWRVDVDSPL